MNGDFDLFELEQKLADEARTALAALPADNPGHEAFARLLRGYEKLLRETKRLLHIADRREAELHRDKSRLGELTASLAFQAEHDPLTGAFNKGKITALIQAALVERECGLLIFDIDHFKRVNDTYGHPAGDSVLRHLVECALDALGDHDCLGRFGGEEFAVLLDDGSSLRCRQVAEQLRASVEAAKFDIGSCSISITISIGATLCRSSESFSEVYARADAALYEAKHSGRNRVVMAPD
jgi:diguanylate cyclase (GGDEF)-like protein